MHSDNSESREPLDKIMDSLRKIKGVLYRPLGLGLGLGLAVGLSCATEQK